MTTPDYKALCSQLLQAFDGKYGDDHDHEAVHELLETARAALAVEAVGPDTDDVLRLAAIIREVDGNHDKGAAALAEAILCHPNYGSAPRPIPVAEWPPEPTLREKALESLSFLSGNPGDVDTIRRALEQLND